LISFLEIYSGRFSENGKNKEEAKDFYLDYILGLRREDKNEIFLFI